MSPNQRLNRWANAQVYHALCGHDGRPLAFPFNAARDGTSRCRARKVQWVGFAQSRERGKCLAAGCKSAMKNRDLFSRTPRSIEATMSFVRFLMLLSLVVWIGGIIFFAFVLAPTVFHPGLLPTRQLAGNVVNRSLGMLHWIGITCGVVFAITSMINARVTTGTAEPFAPRHLLVYLMILLTLVSMFAVGSRMQVLRQQMVMIDDVPQDDPRRVEFNRLHVWSTRTEGAVLVLGLTVLFLTGRRIT